MPDHTTAIVMAREIFSSLKDEEHPAIFYSQLYKFKHMGELQQIDTIDDLAKAFEVKHKATDWEKKDWETEIVKYLAKHLPG